MPQLTLRAFFPITCPSPLRRTLVPPLRSMNVNTTNAHFDLVKQFVRDHDPDVVLLLEVNAAWVALEEIRHCIPTSISNHVRTTSA